MSSRSGATVRAKRTTTPAEYARPQSGPVTSVHSQQIFNSGANTTGVNARINGPSGATTKNVSAPPNQQQQQQYGGQPDNIYNPTPGSKLTINDAVALITLRLGRLETFMNQYQLETPANHGNTLNNEIIQSVLSRISALEQNSSSNRDSTDSKTASKTEITPLILNRIIELEKHSEMHNTNFKVMSEGLKSIENSLHEISKTESYEDPKPNTTTDYISSVKTDIGLMREEFHAFTEDLRETKDLLLRLQSFTMETNAKLVNTIFSQVDQFNIQEYQDEMDDCTYHDDELEEANEVEELGQTKEDLAVDADADVDSSGGIRVNFKELISQELLGISS
jgi:hypothetical protein